MNELEVLRLYMAIKLHFDDPKYNVFENGGRVANITSAALNSNKGRKAVILRLAQKFKTPQDVVQYLVAQYAYGDAGSIFDYAQSEENYDKWMKAKIKTTQIILNDQEEWACADTSIFLKKIVQGKLQIQTAVALNNLLGLIDLSANYFPYQDLARKIVKLGGFVKYNTSKLKQELGIEDEKQVSTL